MKQNIKVFLVALILGMVVAFLVCYKFDKTIISRALETRITIFTVGTYNNVSDANTKMASYNNAMIYQDNNLYKVVIGAYSDKEVIALMESYFTDEDIDYKIEEIKANNTMIQEIKNYELLIKSCDKKTIPTINKSLLNIFREYVHNN